MMAHYNVGSILPHRPPFLYVSDFETLEDGTAVCVLNRHVCTSASWWADERISFLPVEIAAQLMGARLALHRRRECPWHAGFLTGIHSYRRLDNLARIHRVMVALVDTQGAFSHFSAAFEDHHGRRCADLQATLYLAETAPAAADRPDVGSMAAPARRGNMALGANFGRVLEAEIATHETVITRWFDPQSPVYAGHFPDHPVTPGALLAEAMTETALQATAAAVPGGARARLERAENFLFQKRVLAGAVASFRAHLAEEDREYRTYAVSVVSNGCRAARGRITLRLPDEAINMG